MKKGYSHVTFLLDNSGSMEVIKESTIGGFNEFLKSQKLVPGKLTFSLFKFTNYGEAYITPVPVQATFPVVQKFDVASTSAPPIPLTMGQASSIPLSYPGVATSGTAVASGSANCVSGVFSGYNQVLSKQLKVACFYDFKDVQEVPLLNGETYRCETGTPLLDAICVAIDETGRKLAALPEDERPEKVFVVILTDGQEMHSEVYSKKDVNDRITHQTQVYGWEFIFLGANQDAIAVGRSYGVSSMSSMTYATNDASVGASYNALSASLMRSRVSGQSVAFTDEERAAVSGTK